MSEQLLDDHFEHIAVDDQIHLRAVNPSEAADLYGQIDKNRAYLGEYLPWAETQTLQGSKEFIEKIQGARANGEEYGFGVYYEEKLVGHTSLMHLKDEKDPEIGYWVSEDVSGRGITTRVAGALTEFGFGVLHLEAIVIKARIANTGSNKVAEKLGYTLKVTEEDEQGKVVNVWSKTNE